MLYKKEYPGAKEQIERYGIPGLPLQRQLKDIFTILNNNILSGQFAWAKLEKVDNENKKIKKELAKVAGKLLNYY